MNNKKIEQIGVTAIGDRVRSFGSRSVGSPSTSRTGDVPKADAVLEEGMRLFNSRGPRSYSKSISVACFSI